MPVPDDVQDRALAQVEDRGGRDLEHARALVHGDRHAAPSAPGSSRPSGLSTRTRTGRLPVCGSAIRPTNCDLARRGRRPPRPCRGRLRARDPTVLTRAVCPTRTACADRGGSQTDAKTCRVSTTSPIGRADGDRLPGMAGQAVEHAVDRRADGVEVEVGLREGDRAFGRLDLGLGLGHRLGSRADHHRLELGLGRLLLEPGRASTARSASKTCCSETSWRASSGRSRSATAWARSTATLACSTASSLARRSSGRGSDLRAPATPSARRGWRSSRPGRPGRPPCRARRSAGPS